MVGNITVIDPLPSTSEDAVDLTGIGGVSANGLTAWANLVALEGGEGLTTFALRRLIDLSA